MVTMRSLIFATATAVILGDHTVSAFTAATPRVVHQTALSSSTSPCDRSGFLKTSLATIAAVTSLSPTITIAADGVNDDLAMPSVNEQKASEVSCNIDYV